MFLGFADIHSLTLAVYFSMSLGQKADVDANWKALLCGGNLECLNMTHCDGKCYSLQGGDVVVINENSFHPVVEELRVVAFLTWKQKMVMTRVCQNV